jgi:enoyl-CoA hydratase
MTKRGMWSNVEITSLQAALELENRTQVLARTTGAMQAAAARFLARREA